MEDLKISFKKSMKKSIKLSSKIEDSGMNID